MCIFEFDEEKFLKSEREWAYNNGRIETMINYVESIKRKLGISLVEACEILDITVEEYEAAKAKYH